MVENRVDRQAPDQPGGVSGRACIGPAGNLRELAGHSPGANVLVRTLPVEPNGRGSHIAGLSRSQRVPARVLGQAPRRRCCRADRRYPLRCWRAGVARIRRPDAISRDRLHPRAAGGAASGAGIHRTGLRSLLLQRGRGSGAWPGNERFAPEVSQGACLDAGRSDCRRCGLPDRGARIGSDRGRMADRAAAGRDRADDHPFAGRTVGGGLPRYRDAHGRDPWTGPVRGLSFQPSRHGDEERDGLQRGVHGKPVHPWAALGTCLSSAGWPTVIRSLPPPSWGRASFR